MAWHERSSKETGDLQPLPGVSRFLRSPRHTAGFVTILVALLLTITRVGSDLEYHASHKSAHRLRNLLGLSAPMSQEIVAVIFDDNSFYKLKRRPDPADWVAIASHLRSHGLAQVIYQGIADGFDQLPKNIPVRENITAFGTARTSERRNARARPAAEYSATSGYPGHNTTITDVADQLIIGHHPAGGVKAGLINMTSPVSAPAGYRLADSDRYIGHIAVSIVNLPVFEGSVIRHESGVIPVSADGHIYLDYPPRTELSRASVPAHAFFDDQGRVKPELGPSLVKLLQGRRIGVLVPDGFTGSSQYLDGPEGPLSSYYLPVAMMSNILTNHVPDKPYRDITAVLTGAGVLMAAVWLFGRKLRLVAMSAAAMVIYASSLLAHLNGLILPGAQVALIFVVTGAIMQTYHYIEVWLSDSRKSRDLELGRSVQTLLMPDQHSGRIGPWEYYVAWRPYGPMSGDWIQYYSSTERGNIGIIAIGDVVGKGPGAALNTAIIASVWNTFRQSWESGLVDIDSFVRSLSRTIYESFRGEQMSTLSLALITEDQVRLVCCGAPAWLHIAPNGDTKVVRQPAANPIGMDPEPAFASGIRLLPSQGDILVAYTDGVMEGGSSRRKFQTSIKSAGLPEREIGPYLAEEARKAGIGHVADDDFTLLMIRRVS